MKNKRIRVRYAPSPTGPLHLGGVRTALYNYLFAKQSGGDFLLRIEDTDQARFVPGSEEYIIESLNWCGIKIDEGVSVGGPHEPYRQSERKEKGIYRQYAEQLIKNGNAYYAFDTPEELDEMRQRLEKAKVASPQYNGVSRQTMKNSLTLSEDEVNKRLTSGEHYVIRLKVPRNEEVRFHDIIRGYVVVHTSTMDDKVLLKSDGMPTYHLANVVDDYLMQISHVIRGEEWLPSAPTHVLLYRYLGWENVMPQFAHLPLLLKPDGNGKLSKRDGDRLGFPVFPLEWKDPFSKEVSSGYREKGYFPDAFINILALLGWNPGTNQEILSMEELIQLFSLEKVHKAGAKFDPEKAKWFNQQYLRKHSDTELASMVQPLLKEKGLNFSESFVAGICRLMKERATFVKDIVEQGSFFFAAPHDYDQDVIRKKWKDNSSRIILDLAERFAAVAAFDAHTLETAFKNYLEEKQLAMGAAMNILRLVVTGSGTGPSMFEIMALLGKEESLNRMRLGVEIIGKSLVNS
jgi:glutamyl-tRNA synthetase